MTIEDKAKEMIAEFAVTAILRKMDTNQAVLAVLNTYALSNYSSKHSVYLDVSELRNRLIADNPGIEEAVKSILLLDKLDNIL